MIAWLHGVLRSTDEDHVVLDVAGVGYLVFCSGRTMNAMPRIGDPVTLEIETHVREDHIHLYGFTEASERDWFRLLQTVQGIGARVALGMLSVLSPADLFRSIAAQDHAPLTQAPGVGPKLARRVVAELKDKVPQLTVAAGVGDAILVPNSETGSDAVDAVSALVNLGYGRAEAFGAVANVASALGEDASLEILIKEGLKELGR
ncbi:MAG: Holliday junction branch migration protein RuvA [Alphaproteobacteria bacterium]|nr:Holliday junction branch migration protein RuvA [Alphaproteobacteria bacterium]|tara:strand:+ start:2256 stop:2867 length:612 start_codon:yes stop_codon:yes gene_type:complete